MPKRWRCKANGTKLSANTKTSLRKNPDEPSIHYLLGRLLLSVEAATRCRAIQQAKEEFQKELQIDPKNAGAEYILGEMARQESQCDEAVPHFTRAAKLDSSFGDAFMGWGFCLVTLKRYEEAIPPLQAAVACSEGNPSAHYNLAVALSRTGQKGRSRKGICDSPAVDAEARADGRKRTVTT